MYSLRAFSFMLPAPWVWRACMRKQAMMDEFEKMDADAAAEEAAAIANAAQAKLDASKNEKAQKAYWKKQRKEADAHAKDKVRCRVCSGREGEGGECRIVDRNVIGGSCYQAPSSRTQPPPRPKRSSETFSSRRSARGPRRSGGACSPSFAPSGRPKKKTVRRRRGRSAARGCWTRGRAGW